MSEPAAFTPEWYAYHRETATRFQTLIFRKADGLVMLERFEHSEARINELLAANTRLMQEARDARAGAAWDFNMTAAPRERLGPADWENHGPKLLLVVHDPTGKARVELAAWHWHANGKTGNWRCSGASSVLYGTPVAWRLPPPPATP